MAAPGLKPNGRLLNSWKEIAGYLGRGIRTVQRYEHDLGLPIRRPHGRSRSAVIALADDLDAWLHRSPLYVIQGGDAPAPRSATPVVAAVSELRETSCALRARASQLRAEHHATLVALVGRLQTMAEQIQCRTR